MELNTEHNWRNKNKKVNDVEEYCSEIDIADHMMKNHNKVTFQIQT